MLYNRLKLLLDEVAAGRGSSQWLQVELKRPKICEQLDEINEVTWNK